MRCAKIPSVTDAERVAGAHPVPDGRARRELPGHVARQRLGLHAARQEEAVVLGDEVEGVLQAVVHLCQQAGPELDREQLAGELHGVADADAGRALEHLHVGVAAAHADDFGDEAQVALRDVGDLVLLTVVSNSTVTRLPLTPITLPVRALTDRTSRRCRR